MNPMQDWARGRAGGWAQHRPGAWFPSPDAMWCSFLGNGLGDRAAILGVFKPVRACHFALWCLLEQLRPVWARGRCRISQPRFLAECCKRQLNQVSLVLLYFRLSAFSDLCWVCLSVFSCTVLFVSISQVIGCEDRLRNDLYCVGWGGKLYSNQIKPCWRQTYISRELLWICGRHSVINLIRYL